MQSKNALSNLKNRYIAVLKKCNLINTFGALALATMCAMPATAFSAPALEASGSNTTLNNYGILRSDNEGMYGFTTGSASYVFTNHTNAFIYVSTPVNWGQGMYANANIGSHTLINNGTLSITTTYPARGIYAISTTGSHTLINSGIITVSSANSHAEGMLAISATGSHSLYNSGSIFVNSYGVNGTTTSGMFASANNGSHTLTNTGLISVTSKIGEAIGMYATGSGSHTFINSGTIIASSETGDADGMYTLSNGSHTFINSGSITANSETGNASGMFAAGNGSYTLINSGSITASSETGVVYGMTAQAGTGSHTLINSGTITVDSQSSVYGMSAIGSGSHTLINSGTITANSKTASATGMRATTSNTDSHTLINSGSIMANSETLDAYGIDLQGDATINNTGIIIATAPNSSAYEVYGNGDYSVGTYATTLRDWNDNDTVFAIVSGNTITFDNSTLILRPGTQAQGFEFDKEYEVANMVFDQTTGGLATTINGSIAQVKTEVPFLAVHLDNTTPTAPKVSLTTNINEDTLVSAQLSKIAGNNADKKIAKLAHKQTSKMIKARMAKTSSQAMYEQGLMLASNEITAVPTLKETGWTSYIDIYVGYTDNNEHNYNTENYGISLGASKAVSDSLNLGFAADLGLSNSDASDGLSADSTTFTLLTNADYFINDNWYVTGNTALSYADNEMEYALSSVAVGKDDYSSIALNLGASTGYIHEINANNIIVPEIGLNYFYASTDDIGVDFENTSMYNMNIKNDAFSSLYAHLMLTWQGQYNYDFGLITPSASLGVRQNITSADFNSTVDMFGLNHALSYSDNDTSLIAKAGLEWVNGKTSFGLSYDGDFGSEEINHTGSLRVTYKF